jgi:C4-dicarboxylate transporter DctM subunit
MIRFATSMVGHWAGGLGLGAVVACALFAAISGSSPATVVAIGSILMPAMVKAATRCASAPASSPPRPAVWAS